MADRQAAAGRAVFCRDETALGLAVASVRGWMPRGADPTVKTGFSKKPVKAFGVLGRDSLHVMLAGAANLATFKVFLEDLRREYGRATPITDTTPCHRSQYVQDYLASTNGDIVLIRLPPYTPQMNPSDIQRKVIKGRLAAGTLRLSRSQRGPSSGWSRPERCGPSG